MKRFVHYHNVSTGVAFWSGAVEFDEGEVTTDGLNELLAHSRARLVSWSEEEQTGVFAIGPLPGLIRVTQEESPPTIDAFEAARLFEAAQEHPMLFEETHL